MAFSVGVREKRNNSKKMVDPLFYVSPISTLLSISFLICCLFPFNQILLICALFLIYFHSTNLFSSNLFLSLPNKIVIHAISLPNNMLIYFHIIFHKDKKRRLYPCAHFSVTCFIFIIHSQTLPLFLLEFFILARYD